MKMQERTKTKNERKEDGTKEKRKQDEERNNGSKEGNKETKKTKNQARKKKQNKKERNMEITAKRKLGDTKETGQRERRQLHVASWWAVAICHIRITRTQKQTPARSRRVCGIHDRNNIAIRGNRQCAAHVA